jgi:hypothetical protein
MLAQTIRGICQYVRHEDPVSLANPVLLLQTNLNEKDTYQWFVSLQ